MYRCSVPSHVRPGHEPYRGIASVRHWVMGLVLKYGHSEEKAT